MKLTISRNTSTIAKGLFSLFVVLEHTASYIFGNILGEAPFALCWTGMFGFLFLSGYGCSMSYKKNGLDGFWERKIEKIYIPAVLAQIVATLVYVAFGCRYSRDELFAGIVTLSPAFGPIKFMWYLRYLFFWYLVFWITHRFIKNRRYRLAILGG